MAYTDIAHSLLQKRCNFLDSKLSWPSTIGDAAPSGKRYLHFRANGLTVVQAHKATRGSEHSAESSYSVHDYSKYHGESISHMLDQFAVAYEQTHEYNLSWSVANSWGVTDPFAHPAYLWLGATLRSPFAYVMARAYTRHPGLVYPNNTGHVKQLYMPFQVTPASTAGDLRYDLLVSARSHPLRYQLWQRDYNQPQCSVWSARRAGFPEENFWSTSGYIPSQVEYIGKTSSTGQSDYTHCLYANPTILLTTMELPYNAEAWAADAANDGSVLTVKFHSRWVSCPHWMGFAISVDDEWYGRFSSAKVPYVSDNWPSLSYSKTAVFVRGTRNNNDLLLCNPGDRWTDDNPMPVI